ncbi:hypothetical protein [Caballeronia sordidicola]|uniref:Uncharacterized protein n=1 Tax=Caballeronia sordidicola TaxID=196367 RepID=A0A242MVS4_CABSO|nr:hypothetical protein [Caballeronia sordidicola]OTP75412.1 hypothetical protein PAMC26577_13385 [Caballeronia sordidicola]
MKWTQEEAIAFECARECITDMMAICSGQLAEEKASTTSNAVRVCSLETQLARLAQERAGLRGSHTDEIARIRASYGKVILDYRAGHKHPVAA